MAETILVVNAGSSSIKFAVYRASGIGQLDLALNGQAAGIGTKPRLSVHDAAGERLAGHSLDAAEATGHRGAMNAIGAWLMAHFGGTTISAVGHRVVHGGPRYSEAVLIDDAVIVTLEKLVPLAPLHQPHHLAAIRAVSERLPGLPQVACFDTAFHRSQPAVAQAFALPLELAEEGVRRYGFHGISYEYIASVLPSVAPEVADGRVVVAHLGSGASMCAMHERRSVASTMGFTALDGLPMGTRCGSIDPGVLLYLMDSHGMDARAIETLLYHRSGLLGLSGLSNDMRTLLDSKDPRAEEAVDVFVYRIGRELGSLAAALGGLDALVFTAGIGEHSPEIRARISRDAAWLGITLDEAANRSGVARISAAGSTVSAWVLPTDENRMIALHTRDLLDGKASSRRG
ncbi:MAG TPA: acetate/propionate family kinase [Alphaproteobacteria bacterium]|nr:acetate/propionate family kinase [Alphaproteobacteria bacterium]